MIAAASATPALLDAQPPAPRSPRIQGLLDQLNQQNNWRSLELRLLRRISLGMNATEVARVKAMGFSAYLEEQLNHTAIDDSACEARVERKYGSLLARTAREGYDARDAGTENRDFVAPWRTMTAERAAFSARQLHERMVEFWHDHFYTPATAFPNTRFQFDNNVVRTHALGKFGDLVRGSMRDPTMLDYLDQAFSTRFGPNENYARELMELHTVGWNGGYTQTDVSELARILTGWSHDRGTFVFRANNHDFGTKTCLGMTFPARAQQFSGTIGMDEGIAFGEMLINHPSTKRSLSTKLLRWFVRPDPTEAQIQAVVSAYTASGGDIKAMLRVILSPSNLAKAPARLKRPFHYIVSALRSTNATVVPFQDIVRDFSVVGVMFGMGHGVGAWPTPDGYPDRDDFWSGLIVDRWRNIPNIVQSANTSPGWSVVDLSLFTTTPTPDGVVQEINRRILGGEMSPELAAELRTILAPGVTNSRVLDALRLAVMSPEFNFY